MNKNNWNHFKKNLIVILSLIFVLGYTNAPVYGVEFSDYFPLDPASHGFKTFQWTYGDTGTYASYISGELTVPYISGAIEGTGVNLWGDDRLYATNNGNEVKWIAIEGTDYPDGVIYLSSDCSLTAHPTTWALSTVTDDMLLDQGNWCEVSPNLTYCDCYNDQVLLFDIQNVNTPLGQYDDAVIIWYLDTKYSFETLDFSGRDIDLGITLPSSTQTGGDSVTAFDVFAYSIGSIASGDIAAETGQLVNLAELVNIDFPVVFDIVPDTISTKTKKITCNIWPPNDYDVTEINMENIFLYYLGAHIQPVHVTVRTHQQMLVVKFSTSELNLEPGTLELTLEGEIIDGPPFEGTDSVEVVKKGGKPN